ncbi:hypothetical protein [Chitinivibrio alkaliphilus]|uniref:TVP38/TMEM64 family membrane protein n=1 Tax=Chitinivibrio alkaliphilus ACht1 TaxID=1313304 RepID=U7D314_9BACT|nr:hypothetical protein [Chitinivibrio alkaliphilus]ERP30879.1 hypothetical protein CALK_2247 [Chitinivibrio alkaliphilus ACht1]
MKSVFLVFLGISGIILFTQLPLESTVSAIIAMQEEHPEASIPVFYLTYVSTTAAGAPLAALLTIAAGFMYGPVYGVIYTIISGITSAILSFFLGRFFSVTIQRKKHHSFYNG